MNKERTINNDLRLKIAILSISIYVAGNSIISGIVVFMQEAFAISMTSAESLVTISSVATIVTMFLSERITRKIGMKKTVLLGLFLVGLSALIPVFITTYIAVFISRLLMGAGVGLFNGHSANYINAFFSGDEASKLHGIRMSTEFIGQMLLLFLAGLLIKINWPLAFLSYAFAFFIMFNFKRVIPEVAIEESEDMGRFKFNKQIIFYVLFAAIMIMNVTAVSVRFPNVATQSQGPGVDINLYMIALPMAGMISGFLFGIINRALREKTILLGLVIYIISNTTIALVGDNMYIFLLCMVFVAFSQSLCFPYLFSEVARFIRGSHQRIANNLIFFGCNIGSFLSPFFLKLMNTILRTESITFCFIGFTVIHIILLIININEYAKAKRAKNI